MRSAKTPVTLIAVVVAVVMFLLTWNAAGSAASTAVFLPAADALVTHVSNVLDDWNSFAQENDIPFIPLDSTE